MLCILLIIAGIIQMLCLIINMGDKRYGKASLNAMFTIMFLMLAGGVA